ncbi:MAG: hypothetical protein JW874_04280 [Spirochaetales bacterium]|nr:hypothetical protein [Spirochaetales bacterium]
MADRLSLLALVIILLFSFSAVLSAQEETEPTDTETGSEPDGLDETADGTDATADEETVVPDYFFEMRDDGTPFFRQIISWQEVPQCLAYEFILQDVQGNEVYRERTEQASITINLPPGEYQYSIIVYNLLGKAETHTEWIRIKVIKAEIPEIDDLSPGALYIENAKFHITLRGTNLLPDAEYVLLNKKTGQVVTAITEKIQEDNSTVELHLPEKKVDYGDYLVRITNPGGISDTTESGFRVRYQKPVDFCVSIGYAPFVPLYDSWFVDNWSESFYPLGAVARIGLFVLKRRWGHIGPEIYGSFLAMTGGIPEAIINSLEAKAGLNFVYKYLFVPRFQAVIRAGAGVAFSSHGFDYEGTPGPSMSSADLYLTAGLAFQAYISKRLFIEFGADWSHILHSSYAEAGVVPFVSFGFNY